MVRAILEGRKTMTRRVVKFKPIGYLGWVRNVFTHLFKLADAPLKEMKCPYGVPGDRLWVRETWGVGSRPHPTEGWVDGFEYRADEAYVDEIEGLPIYPCDDFDFSGYSSGRWKPSIFMPRAASRILLEVTDIRVERLQEITEADAIAEGVELDVDAGYWKGYIFPGVYDSAKKSFASLWQSINGLGSWDQNPWVWIVSFKRIEP